MQDLGVEERVILKVCSVNRLERHKLKEKRRAVVGGATELRVEHNAVIFLSI